MNQLVCLVFDIIGWLSMRLQESATFLARDDQDLTAALVVALSSWVIVTVFSSSASPPFGRWKRAGVRIVTASVIFLILIHAGTQTLVLNPAKVRSAQPGVNRVTVPEGFANGMTGSRWALVSYASPFSPGRLLLCEPRLRKVEHVSDINTGSSGAYCLKDRSLYFSAPDNPAAGRSSVRTFAIVKDKPWFVCIRVGTVIALLAWALVRLAAVFVPGCWRGASAVFRDRVALSLLASFALFFGSHQWRFVNQDARVQRVTSRFDDAYMLERLGEAARLKTMDSLALENKAYGSIGFHPFAVFPFLAGHLGIRPSVEALNIATRGLKLLISLVALGSVWLLGVRHFGRLPAAVAVVLLGTNVGFLAYSSYPFYPDVLMAAAATVSLIFMLDLVCGWNPRSFLLAVCAAAASVSVKFTTVPLFLFVGVAAVIGVWRQHHSDRASFLRELGTASVKAGTLCVAVFYFCNPYLQYNTDWIVPNYKLASRFYSASTPNFVASAGASFRTWLDACYTALPDVTDARVAGLGLLVALVVAALRIVSLKKQSPASLHALILLLFAALFQLYLARSISLAEGIDNRLALPLYPALYIGAAWGVAALIRLARCVSENRQVSRMAIAGLIVVACVFARPLAWRLVNAARFHDRFGRPPPSSAVSDWLTEADVPAHSPIANGLRSFVPAKWSDLSDGIWQPRPARMALFRNSVIPAVYIESASDYDGNFSAEIASRGFQSDEQRQLHEEGRDFFDRLRAGLVPPFVFAGSGTEVVSTNAIGETLSAFRLYANPLAFTTDLAEAATLLSTSLENKDAVRLTWSAPVTVGAIHISTLRKVAPRIHAKLELTDGTAIIRPVPGLDADERAAQRLLKLDPAADIRSLTLLSDDGTLYPASFVTRVHVHPPVPVGLNTTRAAFKITTGGSAPIDPSSLIDWRPGPAKGVKLEPDHELSVILTATSKVAVDRITVVLEGSGMPGEAACRCTVMWTDGKHEEATAKPLTSSTPASTYFHIEPVGKAAVEKVEIRVSDGRGRRLSQVCLVSHPLP